jgi:hypothetical protein
MASIDRKKATPHKPSLDDDATRVHERAMDAAEHTQRHSLKKISAIEHSAVIMSASVSNPKNPTVMVKSTSTSSQIESQHERAKEGDARFYERDLDSSPPELAAKPSIYSDKQAAKSLSPDKSVLANDSVESII